MHTYKNIQDKVLNYLDQAGDTGHGLDVVTQAIQSAHNKRLSQERWSFMLWPKPVSLAFVTAQRNYTLHPLMLMMTDFSNDTTGSQMHETPTRARYKSGVQEDRNHFEFVQDSPCQLPSSVGVCTITGHVQVTYIDVNGNQQVENITNATTAQSVDTIVGVTNMDLTLAATIVDAGSHTILSLAIGEVGKTYPQLRLYGDGVTGETGTYRFYRRPKDLSNDNDIPDIPYPYSEILIYDALLELYTYNDSTPPVYWAKQQAEWEQRMQQAYQEGEQEGSESRQIQEVDFYQG